MPLIFGSNWNASLNETCTDVAPDVTQKVEIQSNEMQFGAGALGRIIPSGGGPARMWWNAFPAVVDNNGMMGIWFQFDYSVVSEMAVRIMDAGFGNVNNITIYAVNSPATDHTIKLTMHDSGGVRRIDPTVASWTGPVLTSGWHYYELNWLWNNVGGISEFSYNGSVKVSSTDGNSYDRSGSTAYFTEVSLSAGSNTTLYADDFVMYNPRIHTGDFSVPIASQVACPGGAVLVRPATIGAPLGMNRLGN